MARFKFEVVRDLDRLCALAPAWRQLNRRMRTVRHFHVPEWFLALVQALDQYDDTNYLFIMIYDRYELVGIVPLQAVDIDLYGIPLILLSHKAAVCSGTVDRSIRIWCL
jgi:CelD/BcsL family acetyltransferase involved in cellulose biosynthesis